MAEVHSTYPFSVRWLDGKRGLASAPDGLPNIEVASPPQFGGPGGRWTPEHLFVERGDDGRVSIPRLVLRPRVTLLREEDREKAEKMIRKAEETCLIARAMRAAVELEPEVRVAGATRMPATP